MDFTFSDEQLMLRTSVRDVMAARYPIERIADIADGDGFDRTEWTLAVDAGWTGISMPEADGGAGLGFVEEMLVAEELGRALYPGPFLASCVMGLASLLRAAPTTWPDRSSPAIGSPRSPSANRPASTSRAARSPARGRSCRTSTTRI